MASPVSRWAWTTIDRDISLKNAKVLYLARENFLCKSYRIIGLSSAINRARGVDDDRYLVYCQAPSGHKVTTV